MSDKWHIRKYRPTHQKQNDSHTSIKQFAKKIIKNSINNLKGDGIN
jgi:hypothetical protein